jgi:hypothetical protein
VETIQHDSVENVVVDLLTSGQRLVFCYGFHDNMPSRPMEQGFRCFTQQVIEGTGDRRGTPHRLELRKEQ